MSGTTSVTLVVEGPSDAVIVRRIVRDHGLLVAAEYGNKGKNYIDRQLSGFNAAARYGHWLIVRDLDDDAECPGAFIAKHLSRPSTFVRFRMAVRAIESWLLADASGFSKFFSVAPHHIPASPERLSDPKTALLSAIEKSRSRAIIQDMLPAPDTTAAVGPAYVSRIAEFVSSEWSWRRGEKRSESLRRCVRCVAALR